MADVSKPQLRISFEVGRKEVEAVAWRKYNLTIDVYLDSRAEAVVCSKEWAEYAYTLI